MRGAEFRRVCPMRMRELSHMRSNSALMKILGTTVVFLRFQIKFTLRTVDTVKKPHHLDERRSAFHERHQEIRKESHDAAGAAVADSGSGTTRAFFSFSTLRVMVRQQELQSQKYWHWRPCSLMLF